MDIVSSHYLLAQRVSHFMLGFAKAQSLEATLADASTPRTERDSTLCLLWGAILGHVGTDDGDDSVALEVARVMLADLPGGSQSFRWLREHRHDTECVAWAKLCEHAVEGAMAANDPMPALLELAHLYRVTMASKTKRSSKSMLVPGSQLLAKHAHLFRLEDWNPQQHRLH